jgi:hypothetical protein
MKGEIGEGTGTSEGKESNDWVLALFMSAKVLLEQRLALRARKDHKLGINDATASTSNCNGGRTTCLATGAAQLVACLLRARLQYDDRTATVARVRFRRLILIFIVILCDSKFYFIYNIVCRGSFICIGASAIPWLRTRRNGKEGRRSRRRSRQGVVTSC